MIKLVAATLFASAVLMSGVASAADVGPLPASAAAISLKAGAMLTSADGRRVGFVDSTDTAKDGSVVAARVIAGSRMVNIPASTITATDKNHLVTTLSYKDIQRL